ncbi:MAG: tRNA pseudouridine(38-40) synthase TruA [Myxococcota bacterium]
MGTFRLRLEYDGSGFEGWQVQARPGCPTVQGALEEAFRQVTGERVRVVGSGRTDAGVHAEGQVASAVVDTPMAPERLQRALNGVLPAGVAVLELATAPEGFDARRDARSKLYRYDLWNAPVRSPLRAARSLHVERHLDLAALRRAAADLVGTHDFASFQAAGSGVTTTERTLLALDARGEAGGAIGLNVLGSGFLRHMVRNLVGTLLEVGAGRRDPAGMPALLAARDRSRAGPTAPARALTLVRVDYDSVDDSAGSA